MKGATSAPRKPEPVKPAAAFRLRGISVAVFERKVEHQDQMLTFWNVSVQKTYRDGENGFKTTTSFDADDVPTLVFLLNRAYDFIADQEVVERPTEE